MRLRNRLLIAFLVLVLLLPAAAAGAPLTPGADPVAPQAMAAGARDGADDVLILFGPPPDLRAASRLPDKAARGRWVVATLRTAAERSQLPAIAALREEGIAYRAFWALNAVAARLTAAQIERVAELPGVTAIVPDAPFRALPEPIGAQSAAASPEAIEWGVSRVQAPWAWTQGYTGQGVVVAGQDTGYDWDHPALINAYRGYDPATGPVDHDYNWHDAIHFNLGGGSGNACGFDAAAPCDDHGHGTHTAGTMAGNDLLPTAAGWPAAATNAIGVAPGSRWIGCRNMEDGYGTPSTYIECFEWLIAPYPVGGTTEEGDPARAPDIINNSWGCPTSEGCTLKTEIEPILNAAEAAGILVVASAGNSGSACGSVKDPPAIYPAAFSVGAVGSTDALASFSSRGPVTYGGQTYIKPNLSAPGVNVRSSVPGTGYSLMSGTSMAGPHVAGVAALLLSAEPALRGQTDMLKEILARTAESKIFDACGPAAGAVPNNGYGWGIVNAQRAIESLSQPGALAGKVVDAATAVALPGEAVTLYALDGAWLAEQVTDAAGGYSFSRGWGSYRVEVSAAGYDPGQAEPVYVVGGQTTTQDFALAAIPAVAGLAIAPAAGGVQLHWPVLSGNVTGYELWRGTSPYFAPGAAGDEIFAAACAEAGGVITCTDDDAAIGDPATNHFYLALAIGAGGGRSLPSGRVGEFDYTLIAR